MRIFIFLSLVALLAGCATPAERAAQMQREVNDMIQIYGPACEKLGYQAGTDPWRDCILRLDTNATYRRGYPTTTSCIGHRGFMQCTTF